MDSGRIPPRTKLVYPRTGTVDVVDDFHGTPIPDPYRWLEDVDALETRAWIDAQNQVTRSFLERIPALPRVRARLAELWNYPKRWAPLRRGDRYFQLRNTGLQNQDVLYVSDAPDAESARVLLDPNALSSDGTIALTNWSVSKDGRWLAYGTSASGSDWITWRVRDTAAGTDLPEVLEWSKFSTATWLPDGTGFFYARYDPPPSGQAYAGVNYFQKLYLHRRGTPQSDDVLVYHRPDEKEWGFDPAVGDDGRYLVLHVWHGSDSRNRLFYKDLRADGPVIELIPDLEAAYRFVESDGSVFYLRTDSEAPRGRLIAVDVARPDRENWRILIPDSEDTLEWVQMVHEEFVALYLHDAHHALWRFDREGTLLGEVPLPALGSILLTPDHRGLNGSRGDDELFYAFHSFVTPLTIYRYDLSRGRSEPIFRPPIAFNLPAYETKQVFVPSKDATGIPMFIVHKRNLARNGRHMTVLYGYGGFNVSQTPLFDVSRLVWLESGGVLAVANLRGGGEYGEAWHKAGMLDNKQNVFDDFVACAGYLIKERYTSSANLAIQGRSNGGLLVGACMTQRPDLFAAAQPAVGVMDMLRFHKFTIGWAWVSDYGSPDDPHGFRTLYSYSPLHHVRRGVRYPATFITTADHDDRVVPGHSFKFAAALQAAQGGTAPVLIRIQTKAGHGFGKPTSVIIDEQADIWAFLIAVLGPRRRARPSTPAGSRSRRRSRARRRPSPPSKRVSHR